VILPVSLDPPCHIPAERLDPQPFSARDLHHSLHELTGGSGAAQRGWGFYKGDDQRRALTRVAGEHDLTADIKLKAAPLGIVSDVSCHTAAKSAKLLFRFRSASPNCSASPFIRD
jgi:hypothetical protein